MRGRRLAGPQPDRHIADPDGLPRFHRQVPGNAISLVEQADHGDPVGHWSRTRSERLHILGDVDRVRFSFHLLIRLRRHVVGPLVAARDQPRAEQYGKETWPHGLLRSPGLIIAACRLPLPATLQRP